MATVRNQILFPSELLYTDADGNNYYFGEAFRQIVTEGYPLPTLNPRSVTRKTPRGYRPTQQGTGSSLQMPLRQCFQQCAERWRTMPDVCGTVPLCKNTSSKKNIWDGKVAQGVPCSFYDLYMRCCMATCTEMEITIPGHGIITGGTISAEENCFPCDPVLPCKDVAILYTTQQMGPSEYQGLSVSNPAVGSIYHWILAGGGSLNSHDGINVVYHSPADNPDCVNNAQISLFQAVAGCPDLVWHICSSLGIATNTFTEPNLAFAGYGEDNQVYSDMARCGCTYIGIPAYEYGWTPSRRAWLQYIGKTCWGEQLFETVCGSGGSCIEEQVCESYIFGDSCGPGPCTDCPPCPEGLIDEACPQTLAFLKNFCIANCGPEDRRTEAMRAQGCCPKEWL
jgi:hypothetical protein